MEEKEEEEAENERVREMGQKRRGAQRKREREGWKGGLGWVLPCLSVGGGVKLNYPLVPRLPGDVCRGAGALALPPVVGGCIGICVRVRAYVCNDTHIYIYTCARATSSAEAFSIKINTGGWPRPRAPLAPLLVDTDRFDLSS